VVITKYIYISILRQFISKHENPKKCQTYPMNKTKMDLSDKIMEMDGNFVSQVVKMHQINAYPELNFSNIFLDFLDKFVAKLVNGLMYSSKTRF